MSRSSGTAVCDPSGGAARRRFGNGRHVVFFRFEIGVGLFQHFHGALDELVRKLRRDGATFDQLTCVEFTHGWMAGDNLIDPRLSKCRLVAFVVTVPPISDQIDQEVEPELVSIRPGQAGRFNARHGIIRVDVNDRDLESAREAACIARAVRLFRLGRESELVVGDEMNDPADLIALETGQVQRFGNDALTGECRIAMDQNRQHAAGIEFRWTWRIHAGCRRARHAVQHRIDRFEMARIGRHRDDEGLRPTAIHL